MATKKTTDKPSSTTKTRSAKTSAKSASAAAPRAKAAAKPAAKSTATKTTKAASTKAASTKTAAAKAAPAKTATSKAAPKKVAKSIGPSKAPKAAKAAPKKASADSAARKLALAIADAGLEKKAINVQIIDVVGKVDYADYLVVMSGRSDRQVAGLARGVAEEIQEKSGVKCAGVEGLPQGAWVLMDFGDVVVHIFHDDVRGLYDLESLWMDASRVPVPGQRPTLGLHD